MIRQQKKFTQIIHFLETCKEGNIPAQAAATQAVKKFKYCLSTVKLAFGTLYDYEIEYADNEGSFSLRPKRK